MVLADSPPPPDGQRVKPIKLFFQLKYTMFDFQPFVICKHQKWLQMGSSGSKDGEKMHKTNSLLHDYNL